MASEHLLTIGEVAARTGLAVSAIRFYEQKGLVKAARTTGGKRLFRRADLRRLSFVLIAQKLGFSLADIKAQMALLPDTRAPTKKDWARISASFRDDINQRIDALSRMRDTLTSCIGCGCLSLKECALYNPQDNAAEKGEGPRYLLGDRPNSISR